MKGATSSLALHRQAEALMGQADAAAWRGDAPEAARLRSAAGRIEAEAFALIPVSRPKTRRIIAVSATALYLHGDDFAAALSAAKKYLAEPDIAADAWAAAELKAIARDARALAKLTALVRAGLGPEARALASRLSRQGTPDHETARMARRIIAGLD